MSDSLTKRWKVTTQRLEEAYELLRALRSDAEATHRFVEYREMLEHNELELALEELEQLTETFTPPPAVWEQLAVAAESMDLADRAEALRAKMSETK